MPLGDALLWTTCVDQDPLTMQQVVARYRKKLPIIVSVIDGYFGCYGQDIGSNEMFWIYDIARQERVLVRDRSNRYFSIPFDYGIMFHIATDSNKMSQTVMPLKDAMVALTASPTRSSVHEILLQNDQPVTVGIAAKRKKFGRLGVLKVVDTYELKYLQAHSICDDKLDPRSVSIPVFMDLTFSVAIGCRYGTEQDYHEWITSINAIGNSCRHQDSDILCNEIIFFDQKPDYELDEEHYEYMRPTDVDLTQDDHSYELIGRDKVIADEPFPETTTIESLQSTVASLELTAASLPPPVHLEESADLPLPPIGPGRCHLRRKPRPYGRSHSTQSFVDTSPPPPPVPVRHSRVGGRMSDARSHPSIAFASSPPPPPSPLPRLQLMSSSRSSGDLSGLADRTKFLDVPGSGSVSCSSLFPSGAPAAAASRPSAKTPAAAATAPCGLRRYLFASDVPRDMDFASLSKAEVAHLLCLLNLWTFAQTFQELDIDGALLMNLNEDVLTADLGLRPSEARKLMRFAKDRWRPSKKRHSHLTQ